MDNDIKQILDLLIQMYKSEFPELVAKPNDPVITGIGFEDFIALAVIYNGWQPGDENPFGLTLKSQPANDELLANPNGKRPQLVPDPKELSRFTGIFENLRNELLEKKKSKWRGLADFSVVTKPLPQPRTTILAVPDSEAVDYVNKMLMSHYPIFKTKAKPKPAPKKTKAAPAKKKKTAKKPALKKVTTKKTKKAASVRKKK